MSQPGRSQKGRFPDGSPTGEKALGRRWGMVERLLRDAEVAAGDGDLQRLSLRRLEVEKVLPRLTPELAGKARSRLDSIAVPRRPSPRKQQHPPSLKGKPAATLAPVVTRKGARPRKWFVLDGDQQVHREHPSRADSALCGHLWTTRIWEGAKGRNDRHWCPGCTTAYAAILNRERPGSTPQANKRGPVPAALAALQERNARMRKAFEADASGKATGKPWGWGRLMAGSPGLGKRR